MRFQKHLAHKPKPERGGRSLEGSLRSDFERKYIESMSLGDKPALNFSSPRGAWRSLGKFHNLSDGSSSIKGTYPALSGWTG